MKTFRRQVQPPPLVSGYRIDDLHRWSIVAPEATTNLCTNPSFETNTTNWAAVGSASIARSTTQQRRGAYSLAITMTAATGDGAAYGTATALSTTSGQPYTASIDVYAPAGMPLKLYFATTGGVQVGGTKQFKGTGRWQRVAVTYNETSTTSRRIYVTKDASTMTGTVYIDGCQIENKTYDTTYCDGDQRGLIPNQLPPPYQWTGMSHGSTSTRSSQTRGGGRILSLSRYGFTLLGMTGLGLSDPNVAATDYAQIDGGQYQRTQKPPRAFTLAGRFDARTPIQLSRQVGDLLALIDRDIIGDDQPLMLRYQTVDCERAISEEVMVPCVYTGGLEGNATSHVAASAAMSFTIYNTPAGSGLVAAGESGATVAVQQTLSAPDRFILRRPDGTWIETGGVGAGTVWAVLWARDGRCYVAGSFTTVDGGTSANRIAAYDPTTDTWSAFGTGAAGGDVLAIVEGPDGRIYIAGQFTSVNGVANTRGIAVLTPSTGTWAAVGAGGSGDVYNIAFQKSGNLIAIGAISGVSGTSSVASWNGSAWSAVGASFVSDIALAIAPNDTIYVGGTNDVKYWSGSAWITIGTVTGGAARVSALAFGLDGSLYAGGAYTAIGGVSINCIARWNGQSWASMGTGVAGSSPQVYRIFALPNGSIYIGGVGITSANGVTLPNGAAQWNGATWLPLDIIFSGTANLYGASLRSDGTLALGYFSGAVTAAAAGITAISLSGTAHAYPRLILKGPSSGTSRIYQFTNYTTGKLLYLNYTIVSGETAILNLLPDTLTMTSDFQGPIITLPGSDEAEMFLAPGANSISLLSANSTVTAALVWTPVYASLMDAIYR